MMTTYFTPTKSYITNIITKQSPDIAQGVDARAVEGRTPQNKARAIKD
jgi:hypothetical protein